MLLCKLKTYLKYYSTMNARLLLFTICSLLIQMNAESEESFKIRGVLPWHNFMCGPSAWNEKDYAVYLDQCQKEGINFIGFHNYTGGGERYATYVEPMVKISYRNIVPQAYFDNSLTSRWGSLPLTVQEYPFGSEKVLDLPNGAQAFGSDCSILSKSTEEHYANAQKLMQKVLKLSHERGIKMAMGFEFGVVPPEYFSLNSSDGSFYWLGEANMIPNPRQFTSVNLHHAALDNILETYPEIDYIWLWLNEHSFLGVNVDQALNNKDFRIAYDEQSNYFEEATTAEERFIGVWALEYIKMTIDYLKQKKANTKIIIGGWGGGNQLPSILQGLDRTLPKDIIFSCLNPSLGKDAQPEFLSNIALHRDVWAVPWLEGDHQLWHYQPRVNLMKDHVKKAKKQNLQGVVAIHWRTEDVKYNFKTFAHFALNPNANESVEELYTSYFAQELGMDVAKKLAGLMADFDIKQLQSSISSPEFYSFTPAWGQMDNQNVLLRKSIIEIVNEAMGQTKNSRYLNNLKHFRAIFQFELLLNEVTRAMQPAWNIRKAVLQNGGQPTLTEYEKVLDQLESAPVKEMIMTYASRVRSRGEMGILTSINQRLWTEYQELKSFLQLNMK